MQLSLTEEQRDVLRSILRWYARKEGPYITLGGYAGTGKTTVIALLRKILHEKKPEFRVAFCAFTGKASQVLAKTLKDQQIALAQDSVSTLHSLLYQAIVDGEGRVAGWKKKEKIQAHLIIVDEASMINRQLWDDLLSTNIPILAVGDHGQLPPIEGSFSLMDEPVLRLERIHRQAAGNPIIQLSLIVRETGEIPIQRFSDTVIKYDRTDPLIHEVIESKFQSYDDDTLILVGRNKTRVQINQEIRRLQFRESLEPERGDKVMCVKNNWEKHIYNGMVGEIQHLRRGVSEDETVQWYDAEIQMQDTDQVYTGRIWQKQFNAMETCKDVPRMKKKESIDLFDFGYALTVHKAQGSQAKKVIVFEERFQKMDSEMWKRWLYTAVTRAEEQLYIFGT